MKINASISALPIFNQNKKSLNNSLEKLSSGLRINKAADDASGLAIADKLRTQASGLQQAASNITSAVSMMNIADSGFSELSNILDVIKAKAIQMSTNTTSDEGKKMIKNEILALIDSYDQIVESTNYNTRPLLKGCADIVFQVGTNAGETITASVDSVESGRMGNDDPFKLNNFISGFAEGDASTSTPVSDLGTVISSDIPALSSFDWNSATPNSNGEYIFEDFDLSSPGNQPLNLSRQTKNLLNVTASAIKDIEFTFFDFGAFSERFTIYEKGTSNIIGEIYGDNYTGNENVTTSLDTSYIASWDYSNLEHSGAIGTIKLIDIKKDISIEATGDYLTLPKMVITLDDAASSGSSSTSDSDSSTSSCDSGMTPQPRDDTDLEAQAKKLLSVIDTALNQLNTSRGEVGSTTNQLESAFRNVLTGYTNTKAAESIIRDVDYAVENSNFNKFKTIAQAGSFALSQVAENKSRILKLLDVE